MTINGTTTTINTTNLDVADSIIMLSKGLSGNATSDAGILIERGSSGDNAFMGWDHSSSNFVMGTTTANGTATSIDSGFNKGTLNANLTGDVN